jgi:hypothetical protein
MALFGKCRQHAKPKLKQACLGKNPAAFCTPLPFQTIEAEAEQAGFCFKR